MFDFKSLSRLLNYNWKDIFERIVPKDNKEKIDDQSTKDIMSGAILKCIADIGAVVISIILAIIISGFTEELFGGVNLFGISEDIDLSVSVPITLSIAILVYSIVMKDKEQSSLLHFIVLVYLFINSLGTLFSIITWVASMFINPIIGIVGIITVILSLIGNLFIIIGCLDFCCKTKSAYIKKHTVYPEDKGIKTKPININDVSLHVEKKCQQCGNIINDKDKFCKSCGNKIER